VARAWWKFALLAAALLAAAVATQASAASRAGGWVGLASGQVGDYVWSVKTKPSEGGPSAGRDGAERPCIYVGTTWEIGPYSYRRSKYRQCAGPGRLGPSEPPLIASGAQPSTGANVDMTAVGMIFPSVARRVRVTLAGGQAKTIPLHQLSPGQARKAGLRRFRYAAFAVHGIWCAERLVSLDAQGRALWDSGPAEYSCRNQSSP
jgi:hypothetical protein